MLNLLHKIYRSIFVHNHRIAEYFIHTAAKVLKEGGRLILVSKHGKVIQEMAETVGFDVENGARRKYDISICRW